MKKSMFTRGFTLIELLVVIAIIGILAAVVLSSLNDARRGGSDASIQQTMTSLRSQAEMFGNRNSFSYAGFCIASTTLPLIAASTANGPAGAENTCAADAQAWAASVPLNVGGRHFCVDSTGRATTTAAAKGGTATVCP